MSVSHDVNHIYCLVSTFHHENYYDIVHENLTIFILDPQSLTVIKKEINVGIRLKHEKGRRMKLNIMGSYFVIFTDDYGTNTGHLHVFKNVFKNLNHLDPDEPLYPLVTHKLPKYAQFHFTSKFIMVHHGHTYTCLKICEPILDLRKTPSQDLHFYFQ